KFLKIHPFYYHSVHHHHWVNSP
uniref:Uncharacterized protein n=1 Tax=Solanum lycopersicum TaxID=4081 RepID=A0A3Q7EDN4_SOLLC